MLIKSTIVFLVRNGMVHRCKLYFASSKSVTLTKRKKKLFFAYTHYKERQERLNVLRQESQKIRQPRRFKERQVSF